MADLADHRGVDGVAGPDPGRCAVGIPRAGPIEDLERRGVDEALDLVLVAEQVVAPVAAELGPHGAGQVVAELGDEGEDGALVALGHGRHERDQAQPLGGRVGRPRRAG